MDYIKLSVWTSKILPDLFYIMSRGTTMAADAECQHGTGGHSGVHCERAFPHVRTLCRAKAG